VLGNGDDHRLVSRRRHDSSHSVGTSGETGSDGDDDVAIRVLSTVDTLEERKLHRVGYRGRVDRRDRFDNDVGVPDDLALRVEGLRVGIVGLRRVREGTKLDVLNTEGNVEGRVSSQGGAIGGILELARGDVSCRRDVANGGGVARPVRELETVRNGYRGQTKRAEVDEIVRGDSSTGLTSNGGVLASSSGLDDGRVKGQRGLEITRASARASIVGGRRSSGRRGGCRGSSGSSVGCRGSSVDSRGGRRGGRSCCCRRRCAGGGNPGVKVSLRSAGDAGASRVRQGEGSTDGCGTAGLENKLAANTLGKLLVHTRILTLGTRAGGREGGKLRVLLNSSLAIDKSERLTTAETSRASRRSHSQGKGDERGVGVHCKECS